MQCFEKMEACNRCPTGMSGHGHKTTSQMGDKTTLKTTLGWFYATRTTNDTTKSNVRPHFVCFLDWDWLFNAGSPKGSKHGAQAKITVKQNTECTITCGSVTFHHLSYLHT